MAPAVATLSAVREGDRPSQTCLALEGVSCRFRIVGDGSRQIFHVPGDIPDLQSLHRERTDHSLTAPTCSSPRQAIAIGIFPSSAGSPPELLAGDRAALLRDGANCRLRPRRLVHAPTKRAKLAHRRPSDCRLSGTVQLAARDEHSPLARRGQPRSRLSALSRRPLPSAARGDSEYRSEFWPCPPAARRRADGTVRAEPCAGA